MLLAGFKWVRGACNTWLVGAVHAEEGSMPTGCYIECNEKQHPYNCFSPKCHFLLCKVRQRQPNNHIRVFH
jgi:hypothetical protein